MTLRRDARHLDALRALSLRIAALRKQKGLSRVDLAVAARLSPAQIQKLEHPELGANPRYDTLLSLAQALKVTIHDLLPPPEGD